MNKLNITDKLTAKDGRRQLLNLRHDLDKWIADNTTGSQNSAINFLVNMGINQIELMLEHDSLYETVVKSEFAKK